MRSWLAIMVGAEARSGNRSTRAVQALVESTAIGHAGVFERGDDKARIGTVRRVLGLADNAPFAAPAVTRAIAEVTEHPGGLARGQAQAPGLGTLFAERGLQAGKIGRASCRGRV